MKQVSQNYKTGAIRLEQTNVPAVRGGGVLVRTHYSVVSAGTEGMKVKEGKMSYLGKARARPDQVKKVFNTLRQQGLAATYQKVMNKLDKLTPLGYSLSGEVIAVGSGAEEFRVGQRVACGGAGYANHAEVNFVPKNLVVPIPDSVSTKHAAFATVGAIAMQGFRQAEMQLGETACVVGLGLLGQLLVQILRAAGVTVIGVDIVEARCELALKCGAAAAVGPDDPRLRNVVGRMTDGHGADTVFITAGGSSNGPLELAVSIARDRARIVDIGKTKLDLPWNDCYMKELNVRFSRSYGPGRYDPQYEEQGLDYPIGYVRWTERRNMSSFLDLVTDGRVQLEPIISSVRSFEEAEHVYQELAEGKGDSLGTVFEYALEEDFRKSLPTATAARAVAGRTRVDGVVRLAAIGAGNYASTMLLPHLKANRAVVLDGVATASGLSGQDARRKFGFRRATTNHKELLESADVDAVVIATRHSSHARMVVEAIRAGKAVYVEKPLALNLEEVKLIREAIAESGNDRLMVGFNRRFAPVVAEIAKRFRKVQAPLTVHYRIHAGQLESGSWYLDRNEGSRFVGEGGHFIDTISFISGSRPVSVFAQSLRPEKMTVDDLENIAIVMQFENGSVGNILYLTQGGPKSPKEFFEVFGGGVTAQMHNFESVTYYEGDRSSKNRWRVNKGQKEEMDAYIECVKSANPLPISLTELIDTTLATLAVIESLKTAAPIHLADLYKATD
ncbi:MAG: bi-domain-containing oxidoreductase [Sulfuricaulis sp.]|uniref:bi-domain-containing oxidoreductase n=1 Tax=Sulfuricaulis sp. TaxID=2003553 RepID=UPI0034A4ED07